MKYLVVYDTAYGNTAAVAAAIREGLGADASAREVETLKPEDMKGVDLLVVGSPTQGGRPTGSTMDWVQSLPFVHGCERQSLRFPEGRRASSLPVPRRRRYERQYRRSLMTHVQGGQSKCEGRPSGTIWMRRQVSTMVWVDQRQMSARCQGREQLISIKATDLAGVHQLDIHRRFR